MRTPVRCIRTPLTGFEEELPPSLGRTSAKGELSNVNIRSKAIVRCMKQRQKKKLLTPTRKDNRQGSGLSAEQIKSDFQKLLKKSSETYGSPLRGEGDIFMNRDVDERAEAYTKRLDAQRTIQQSTRRSSEDLGATEEAGLCAEDAYSAVRPKPMSQSLSTLSEAVAVPMCSGTDRGVLSGPEPTENSLAIAARSSHSFPLKAAPTKMTHSSRYSFDPTRCSQELSLEKVFAVTPCSTVFGSDLDRLERDMMREYEQRGKDLPPLDAVYSQFGSGRGGKRMAWQPSSSFDHFADSDVHHKGRHTLGCAANRNLAAYHMSAEAYRERQEHRVVYTEREAQLRGSEHTCASKGTNYRKVRDSLVMDPTGGDGEALLPLKEPEVCSRDQPAQENPHFPLAEEDEVAGRAGGTCLEKTESGGHDFTFPPFTPVHHLVVDARRDYKPTLTTAQGRGNDFQYDAYNQRPADNHLLELRGVDYWADYGNRKRLEEHLQHRCARLEMEKLSEGAMDSSEIDYSINRVRKEVFLYFQAHPINEMIQESFVRIRQIDPKDGSEPIVFNPHEVCEWGSEDSEAMRKLNADVDIPLQEARRMAQELGLDLIRVGSFHTTKTDRRIIALCLIGDHREHMRKMIRFKIKKLGVQPPVTKACIEVPFRGGTHPHAIRFKSVGIAKHILHRHTIRVNLTEFGTPREGFPVFQSILDEIKRQCTQLRAYHKAGEIQFNYNEIFCYLFASTGRSPKTTVDHPSLEQVHVAREMHILENEKEIYFDDLYDQPTSRERLAYLTKLGNGTAWAEKDEGLSLQRQRAIKVMLGYIPKGNKDLYAARGDVNIPAPFRASHLTSVEKWTYPLESNLEQASRGAAALGKRAAMPVSEMHDQGETPENPTQLDRFYYRVQGSALEVGEFKEALGLKDNRKKRPPLAPGFATLGMGGNGMGSAVDRQQAVK